MTDYIAGKTIVVTGAASGFGRLVSQKAAALGARVVAVDVNAAGLAETAEEIQNAQGAVRTVVADVCVREQVDAAVAEAVNEFGAVDVMINNAGIMPLAFYADHAQAQTQWDRCIDINIKGVLNGMVAVYDQMIAQGRGHIINLSSIYGNFPVVGAGVYGASKAAVNFLSESLRVESAGKIKVTIVKPTGVPGTALGAGVVNPAALVGILGQNNESYMGKMMAIAEGTSDPAVLSAEQIEYGALDPVYIADQIIYAINQPWGVSIGDITVRAAGDGYIL